MRNFVHHSKSGFVHHSKSGHVKSRHGSGIKAIVHHRHERHYDPNVEMLKESLHNLSLHSNPRMRKQSMTGGSMKKKSKYIVF